MAPISYQKLVRVTALLTASCLFVVGLIKGIAAYIEYQSYRDIVLMVMNGDVRMAVGNELFECKGGRL